MRSVIVLTVIAMTAFAANSLLARLALGTHSIDAASYTAIRILSGAVFLYLVTRRKSAPENAAQRALQGNWTAAAALFAYAIAFSYAYLALGAATGALILFSSVQATMILWSVRQGNRPSTGEIVGFATAFAGFVWLVLPGIGRPDPLGCLLMVLSGMSWGIYTLKGRSSSSPLADTAGNFVRAGAFCVPLAALAFVTANVSYVGVSLALASGVVASGLGYAIWYLVLPALTAFQAALIQLSVPVIAAAGAILFLGETLSLRFAAVGIIVLGGIALAITSKQRKLASTRPLAERVGGLPK
jgi:drug/metabolite transporter (DMT)-like permease